MVLLLAAAVLAVPAASVVWGRSTLRDAAAWRSMFGPIHEDHDLARTLAEKVADQYGTGSVPRDRVVDAAELAITSELFGTAWEAAIVEVHGQALAVVDGDRTQDVALDLSPVIDQLEAQGLIRPGSQDDRRSVELVAADDAGQLRAASDLLDRLALVLPLAATVLAALGLLVARNRLGALVVLGGGVAVVALGSALVTVTVPEAVVGALVSGPAEDAARAAADAFTSRLVVVLLVTAGVAGAVALAAAVADRVRPAR